VDLVQEEEYIRVSVIVVVGDDAASVSVSIAVIVLLVPIITKDQTSLHCIVDTLNTESIDPLSRGHKTQACTTSKRLPFCFNDKINQFYITFSLTLLFYWF
jgi:hypothetical protein